MKYLYKRTLTIDELIRNNGYNLVTIWEHEFDRDMRNMKLNEYDLMSTLKLETMVSLEDDANRRNLYMILRVKVYKENT